MKTNELNHKLYLYRPSGETSDFLGELLVDNLNVDIKLHDISSISFTIPRVINGVPNPRIDQVLDNYIVELHYGRIDETYPDDYFKMRFVIYKTPSEFSDSKFIHSYQGSSTESLLEFKLINNWPGVEVYDFFRTINYNRASNNFIEGSLVATLATGTNVVTLTTGTTSGLIAGQILTKISGDGVFGTDARVGAITNPTQFTVVNSSGTALNHATLGAITFSATTYVNQESNASTGQRYIRLSPVRPGGVDTVYPLDIFLYEIRKKIVVGEEIETKNALIQFDYAGKTYTHADFKVGYYYLSLNGDGTVEYIYIALPDNDVTYNTSTNNYLYNTFTSDYTFSYRLYDNPITKTYAVGPNSTDEANPLNNMYITLATDADQGDLTPEYGTPQISYNSQKIYSKNGLTLRQILTGKTLESADTPNTDGLLYDTGYTIGTIHADIQDLYRSNLQFNNITRLQAIKQVAESFKAFIVFDTITKTMSFYPENAYGTNKGLILRYASYLKSLNKEVDSSKIITLATAIGKDKTTLNLINPTGKSYWEDYAYFLDSYFINTDDNDILTLISGGNLTLTIESKRLKTDSRINTSITHNALKVLYTGSTANFTNRWFSTTAHAKVLGEWQFARDLYHEIMLGNIEPDTDLDVSLAFLQRYYDLYKLRDEEIKNYVKLETQLAEYEASMYKSKYLYEYYKKEWDELTATQQTTAISNGSQTWLRYNKYRLEFTAKTIELEAFKISILNPIKDELFGTTASPYGAADSVLRKLLEVQSALHRQSTATDSGLTTCIYVINPIESLNDFKRNAVNNDSSIDNELELLKSTKIYLNENKYPKITVNLDTASLISAEEARQDWNKSFVGDKLYVFLPELNVDLEVQVREVSIDFESNSMSLTISNVRNYNRTFGRFLTKVVRNLYNSNQNITTFYQDQYNEGSKKANEQAAKKKTEERFDPQNKSGSGAQDEETGESALTMTGAGIESASVESVDEAIQTFTLVDKAVKGLSQVDGALVAYYDRGAGGIRTEVEISGDNGIVIKRISNVTDITDKQMYIDTSGNAVFGGQLIVGGQVTPIDAFEQRILDAVAVDIAELQNQVDGAITTWFGDENPVVNPVPNYPTNLWAPPPYDEGEVNEYNRHVGDLFYNNVTGKAFRFVYTLSAPEGPEDYSWVEIVDTDITLALSNAAAAQATADKKITVFYATTTLSLQEITPGNAATSELRPKAEVNDIVIISSANDLTVTFTINSNTITQTLRRTNQYSWNGVTGWELVQDVFDKEEGSVGGWTVASTSISSNNNNVVLSNAGSIGLKKTSYGDNATPGAFLGMDGTTAKFNVGNETNFLRWTGTALEIQGTIKQSTVIEGALTKNVVVTGGNRTINYDANGVNPAPGTLETFTAVAYANGSITTTGLTYAWTSGGVASGTASTSTFSPVLNASHQTSSSFVQVVVTYPDATTFTANVPITVTKTGATGATGAQGDPGATGTAAKVVNLTATTQAVLLKADGTVNGAQSIVFTTETQGAVGTTSFTFSPDVSSIFNSSTKTLAFADNATQSFPITVTFGDGTTQDTLTIIGVRPGADGDPGAPGAPGAPGEDGDDAVNAFLTNESHIVQANSAGTVLAGEFALAITDIVIFVGVTNDTANWSISRTPSSGITLSAGNTFPITAMSVDTGTITLTASKAGFSNITKIFTVTKSKQGVQGIQGDTGAAGTNARAVSLTATNYVVVYDANGENPVPSTTTDITLTATSQNFSNGFFKFTGDGLTDETTYTDGTGQNSDTFVWQVPVNYFDTPQTIRVGVSDGNQTELAFDTITITAVKPGIAGQDGEDGQPGADGTDGQAGSDGEPGVNGLDAYTVILTNEAHTLPTTNTGTVTYTGSGTSIVVYKGTTELNGIISGTPIEGQFLVTASGTNITASTTPTSVGNPVIFGDHSNMEENQNTAEITYTINAENLVTFTKKQTFSKSIQGSDGASGIDAKTVSLTAANYVITYNADGTTPSPSGNLLLTASQQNFVTPRYRFTIDGTVGSWQSGNTANFSIPATYFSTPKLMKVDVAEGASSETPVAFDTITIVGVKPGINGDPGTPGAAGDDAIVGFLTNESHVVAAETDGTGYSLTTAGGTFTVFEGINDITGASVTYSIQGTNPVSGLTIAINSSGIYSLSGASWTSNEATFTLRAAYSGLNIDKVYTISKSIKGTTGAQGDPGPTGPSGPGVVYRGDYKTNTLYFNTSIRTDVVSNANTSMSYWIALQDNFQNQAPPATGNEANSFWAPFGAQFSSVATGLLIAEESFVKNTLNIGTNAAGNAANITIAGASTTSPYLSIGQSTKTFGTNGIFLGMDSSVAKFSLKSASNELTWNGSTLGVVGDIGGTIGTITVGNIVINNTGITTTTNKFSVDAGTGVLTAVDGIFSGTITAGAGAIAGWTILDNQVFRINSPVTLADIDGGGSPTGYFKSALGNSFFASVGTDASGVVPTTRSLYGMGPKGFGFWEGSFVTPLSTPKISYARGGISHNDTFDLSIASSSSDVLIGATNSTKNANLTAGNSVFIGTNNGILTLRAGSVSSNQDLRLITSGTGKVRYSNNGGSSFGTAQNGGFDQWSTKIVKKEIEPININEIEDFINKVEIKKFKYKENDKYGISFIIEDEIEKNIPFKNILFKRSENITYTSFEAIPEHLKPYVNTDSFAFNQDSGEYAFLPLAYDFSILLSLNTAVLKNHNNKIKELQEENKKLKEEIALIKAALGIS